jgi:hypothetical protein
LPCVLGTEKKAGKQHKGFQQCPQKTEKPAYRWGRRRDGGKENGRNLGALKAQLRDLLKPF